MKSSNLLYENVKIEMKVSLLYISDMELLDHNFVIISSSVNLSRIFKILFSTESL